MNKVISADDKILKKKLQRRMEKANYWMNISIVPYSIGMIMFFFHVRFPIFCWPIIYSMTLVFTLFIIGLYKGVNAEGEMFRRGWIEEDGIYY